MIVPSSRLLFWVAMIVLPFALLGAVQPSSGIIAIVAIGGLFLAVIVDAISARKTLAGISVQLPEIVRASKDRSIQIEVSVGNLSLRAGTIRVGFAMPRDVPPAVETMDVTLPGGVECSKFLWTCTPARRGNYRLDAAHVEAGSPFGFWAFRSALPVQCELRVYPNLLTERRNLAALFLHRGQLGVHSQRQVGKGRDFEKLRDYIPGDGFDEVHWKATARRGKPITKVFQIERTQEVYVIVDASRLSARRAVEGHSGATNDRAGVQRSGVEGRILEAPPVSTDSILERFVTAALVMGLAAEQQGDLFGLLTYSDRVEKFIRARNGQAHYSTCRDALYTLQPKVVTPDFDELCTFIRLRLRRRALLVFLTSLDDPALAENFVRNLELIHRQHLVLVNMLQPPGAEPLFSNPDVVSVDDLYRHLGGHLRWQRLRELEKVLQRRGVRFSLLQNERLSADLVSRYLSVKQRQLL
jgi:uncharacterized protein (DUF58 family)